MLLDNFPLFLGFLSNVEIAHTRRVFLCVML